MLIIKYKYTSKNSYCGTFMFFGLSLSFIYVDSSYIFLIYHRYFLKIRYLFKAKYWHLSRDISLSPFHRPRIPSIIFCVSTLIKLVHFKNTFIVT
jgi:hypothetical protein